MAKPHQRAFALILALLFLLTSIGTGAAVIWQIRQDNKDNSAAQQTEQPTQEGALKGTKLEGFEPVATVSELQKIDLQVGTGDEAKEGATVTAHYTGARAKDGIIFESSKDSGQPATFPLDQVIKGWQEGVPGMKVGGKRRLIIPAEKAYGAQSPSADIPANSDLVFDIELVGVQ